MLAVSQPDRNWQYDQGARFASSITAWVEHQLATIHGAGWDTACGGHVVRGLPAECTSTHVAGQTFHPSNQLVGQIALRKPYSRQCTAYTRYLFQITDVTAG